jgi:hypothetical protein
MKQFRFEVREESTYTFDIKAKNQKEAIQIFRNTHNDLMIDDNLESSSTNFDLYEVSNYE